MNHKKSLFALLTLFAVAVIGAACLSGHTELALSLLAGLPLLGITGDPMSEIKHGLTEIKSGVSDVKRDYEGVKTSIQKLQNENAQLSMELSKMRRAGGRSMIIARQPDRLSDECAAQLGGAFIIQCARRGLLEQVSSNSNTRDQLLNEAKNALGIEMRTALTTSDIPLPTDYGSEMRELIAKFGILRGAMTRYPIGAGTSKPPRWGTRPAFGSIAMGVVFPEKSPTLTFASLESHKIGGLVQLPRELSEGSTVDLGQYLARYGATEFARAEDTWGFLADGTATYESVKGICQICSDNNKKVQLGATKTTGADVALADLRALRALVTTAVLSSGKYYLNATWEARLRNFNTITTPNIYVQNGPMGQATLDGYPIVWTEVLAPFATTANASAYCAVFGDLGFWWMGEHLTPRIDTSDQVYFLYDNLAVRFIEEIDFDYMDLGAAAALQLAAA